MKDQLDSNDRSGYAGMIAGVAVVALIGGMSLRFINDRLALTRSQDQTAIVLQNIDGGNSDDAASESTSDQNAPVVDELFSPSPLAPGETENAGAQTESAPLPEPPPAENSAAPVQPPAPSGPPNLVAKSLVANPGSMNQNAPIRFTATVANEGGEAATNVSGYLVNVTNQYAMGTHSGYTIVPGQVFEFWEENAYPYFATCANGGANTFRFTVDPQNLIAETNETDNTIEISAQLLGCN